ncbi:hypothetical protein SAMN05443549_10996 [Flavobacterium fluvii]|uniref:Uncharacterized protein n=1 Tax=Flavobacterium fluvii TaxID=468056 RepID=A0A1M5P7T0_9FLAO|nr:hypothetical protein SAMN05443549_10996 [Flavobacterium fluvii]
MGVGKCFLGAKFWKEISTVISLIRHKISVENYMTFLLKPNQNKECLVFVNSR